MNDVVTGSDLDLNCGYQTWLGSPYRAKRNYGPYVAAYVRHDEPYIADDVIYFDSAGGQRVYIVPYYDMVIVRTGTGGLDFSTGSFFVGGLALSQYAYAWCPSLKVIAYSTHF